MDELVRTLNRYGIDTAQLHPLYDAGPETTYYMSVPGVEAFAWWEWLRKLTERTGYWPVLLGYEEYDLRWHEEVHRYQGPPSTETMIAVAIEMDPPKWFQETLEDEFAIDSEMDETTYRGEWPEHMPPSTEFLTPYTTENSTFSPRPIVYLGLVPARTGWQVPILLRFGNWNSCPSPETHAGVLRYWEERYGAELVTLTHDVIELRVAHPPQDPKVLWPLL